MSRLVIPTNSEAQNVVEGFTKIWNGASSPARQVLCPVDLTAANF